MGRCKRILLLYSCLLITLLIPSIIFSRDSSLLIPLSSNPLVSNLGVPNPRISSIQLEPTPPSVLKYLDWAWYMNDPLSFDSLANYSFPGLFMFDTLVEFDFKTGELIPSLAKQWVVSNDSKHWIFSLREDVWFHDGGKFNATSVKYNYDRLIDPSHPAYAPEYVFEAEKGQIPLESVTILGEYKVEINFQDSYAPFISVVATSLELLAPQSFNGSKINEPIGTGPYKFEQFSHYDDKLILDFSRNANYFRGVPPFEEIQYIYYYSFDDLESAVLSQDGDLSLARIEEVVDDSTYWEYSSAGSNAIELGWLNQKRLELTHPKVRQAMNYAIDKDKYIPYSYNETVSHSIFANNLSYFDVNIPGFPYNYEKANQLLDEAGYPRQEDDYRFDLQFIGTEAAEEKYEVLIADLDAVGIRCELMTYPWAEFIDRFFQGTGYDLTVVSMTIIPDPSYMRALLHSTGVVNFCGYSSPEMDDMLTKAQQTPVHQEQEFYYKQVQSIAQNDAPYLLLQNMQLQYLRSLHVAPYIKFQPSGRLAFNYSTAWQSSVKLRINADSSHQADNKLSNVNWINNKIYTYEDVQVINYSTYFPFIDAIFTNLGNQESLTFNVRMSYDLQSFLPAHESQGKFYEIVTNQASGEYGFRCYYDLVEVEGVTVDRIYEFDNATNSWLDIETRSSNDSLRFIEVHLKGGYKLLRLGETILQTTYTYLPFIILFLGTAVSLGVITIFINRHMSNLIKERFNLQ
jgi:peptide/nickel transport system substrate-binding protein